MSTDPGAAYIGRSMPRVEDERLLRGAGTYVDDIALPGTVEVAFLRSVHAHAEITHLDLSAARAVPGVLAVYGPEDIAHLAPLINKEELRTPPGLAEALDPLVRVQPMPLLTGEVVTHVGQPVAMVVAETRYLAEDAIELIDVDYDPLPVVTDPDDALRPDAPIVQSGWEDNVALAVRAQVGDADAAFAEAAAVVTEEFHSHRYVASPIEPRAVLAASDPFSGRLTIWSCTQTPHRMRDHIASSLSMSPDDVRVIAADVGGGFGQKGVLYVEELLIPFVARQLGRPVLWREDRVENLTSSSHAREQTHRITLAATADGRLLGLRDRIIVNFGAFNSTGLVVPYNALCHLLGPYKVPAVDIEATGVLTNTMWTSPYRGAGRPEAVFAMERALDRLARKLDIEPAELRARNLIRPEEMPYKTGLLDRKGVPQVIDSGDFPELLDRAVKLADLESVRRQQQDATGPCRIGIGFANYIEATGLGPFETARISVLPTGRIRLAVGTPSQGQGHRTSFAQIAADALGVPPDRIDVIGGDTDTVPFGVGTIASRSLVTAGNATHQAGVRLRAKVLTAAAQRWDIALDQLHLSDGIIVDSSDQQRHLSLAELAGVAPVAAGPESVSAELSETVHYRPPGFTFASGINAAVVEVDETTGEVRILKFVVVHDAGKIVNPLIAEGQITGGIAQGIGGALYEEMIYDADGQPRTASYMDYLVPTSSEIPDLVLDEIVTPSTMNELGVKGLGEGGAIAPAAALANAVEDALHHHGVVVRRGPLSPNRVRELIRTAPGDTDSTTN